MSGINIGITVIYESVKSIRERDLIWTSGLGYVPVVIKEKRVLAKETFEK